jgi:hypothetical protein
MVPLKKPKVTVKDIPLMKLSEPATCFELARKNGRLWIATFNLGKIMKTNGETELTLI